MIAKIRDKIKELDEERLIDNDVFFVLTYMASLSTARLSRNKIFEMVAEKKEYYVSKYFKKIVNLVKNWNYDYATACEIISKKVKNERLKRFFDRLSNAISAGEPEEVFLKREWKVFKTIRKDEYERNLESLKKWTDAYTSIIVSTALISVVFMLSIIIYSIKNPKGILHSLIVVNILVYLLSVFILYKASPKDKKTHNCTIKSKEQRLLLWLTPISVLLSILFLISFITNKPNGLFLIFSAISLLPTAILSKIDDTKIDKRDEAFTMFIRSLGSIKSGAGISMTEALGRIDQKNLGELKEQVLKLYKMLSVGIDPKICWNKFIGESGSYLIQKFTSIFVDAVDLGGDAELIGEIVGTSNLEMVLLRLKRKLISSSFINLIIVLHASMVALLLFIVQILDIFSGSIIKIVTGDVVNISGVVDIPLDIGMSLLSNVPIDLLQKYVSFLILSMTFANTLAANIVKGGSVFLYTFYACIFLIISGILYMVVPPLVKWIFSIQSFMEVRT